MYLLLHHVSTYFLPGVPKLPSLAVFFATDCVYLESLWSFPHLITGPPRPMYPSYLPTYLLYSELTVRRASVARLCWALQRKKYFLMLG
jgi:hypothetical protein